MVQMTLTGPDGASKAIPLGDSPLRIGKKEENDLVLAGTNISRRHCEIYPHNGRYAIRDIGSSNGTFVNGTRIQAPVYLVEGTIVQLGDYRLIFGAPPTPTAAPKAAAPQKAAPEKKPPAPTGPKAEDANPEDLVDNKLLLEIHSELLEHRDIRHLDLTSSKEDETRVKVQTVLEGLLEKRKDALPSDVPREKILKILMDQTLGLGPLEDLLADDDVSEIMVNRCDQIYIERKGKIVLSSKRFVNNPSIIHVIQRILSPIGRRIDESSPLVDGRLADGSRVNAIIPPLAISGPSITIRKFMKQRLGPEDLVRFGSMTAGMSNFLRTCVLCHKNVVISGGTGSGKTTLLNVLSSHIPADERIVTIEDAAELKLPQDHVVSLESKPANIEGKGAIPIRALVINSLRMRPDRIVVGECRGSEAFDMLQAMNTGHDGSLTTLHANTPRDAIARLENMVLMAGMDLPAKAIRDQITSAIHVIVQQSRLSDGSRRVTYITEVTGMEGDIVTLQDIFLFQQQGYDEDGKIRGYYKATGMVPRFYDQLRASGRSPDMSIFSEGMV